MNQGIDEQQWREAAARIEPWTRILLLSHARPDGDALGSLAAMKRVLEAAGKQADAAIYDQVPKRYAFLSEDHAFTEFTPGENAPWDGIVIVDTCSWSQLEPVAEWLKQSRLPRVVVDHHATRDDIAGASASPMYLIDPTSASACGLVYRWAEVMGWPVDRPTAEALYVGMATDTGWFRFSNTDGETMRLAGLALEAGVRADRLYSYIYESRSPARIPLMAEVLSTLQYHADGRMAVMWVTPEMIEFAGAAPADTEEFVNMPLAGEGVLVSILITQQEEGPIRLNLRSKSPEVCGIDVDVAELAKTFDGGGHRRAAGARVDQPLDVVRDQVVAAAVKAIERAARA